MYHKLLCWQCAYGIPDHIAIILDGKQNRHYQEQTIIDLLPLIKLHQKFKIPFLTIILVTQASLQLPQAILETSLEMLEKQISTFEKMKENKFLLSVFGDVQGLKSYDQGIRVLSAIQNHNKEALSIFKLDNSQQEILQVRLGIFYSSQQELFEKAKQLKDIGILSKESLEECYSLDTHNNYYQSLESSIDYTFINPQFPGIDIFMRTSGDPKLSDLLLFDITGPNNTFIYTKNVNVASPGYFYFYRIITQWQFFQCDHNKIQRHYKKRQEIRRQQKELSKKVKEIMVSKGDELDHLRGEYNSDTEGSNDSSNLGRAYFVHD